MITDHDLLEHKAFQLLQQLPLEQHEYAIMGSGIMFVLGIRKLETLDDLDLLVTESGWDKVKNMAPLIHDEEWDCDHLLLFDGLIEIWNGWGPTEYDAEKIIQDSYRIGKFNFMSLQDAIRWKTEMGRDKDKKHLAMIQEFLDSHPGTDYTAERVAPEDA